MIKKIVLVATLMALSTSCVTKKVYQDLENKFADLKKERNALADENEGLKKDKSNLQSDLDKVKAEADKCKTERDKLAVDYAATKKSLDNLKASYAALEKDSNEALEVNIKKNRELLAELEAKEKAVASEKEKINKIKKDFETNAQR